MKYMDNLSINAFYQISTGSTHINALHDQDMCMFDAKLLSKCT